MMKVQWTIIYFRSNTFSIKKKAAFLNIGTLYRGRGQYDSAIHFYDKAIETDSTYQKAKEEKEEVLKLMIRNKKLLLNNWYEFYVLVGIPE